MYISWFQWSYREYGKHGNVNTMEWNFPIYLSLPLTMVCSTIAIESWGGIYGHIYNNKVSINYDLPAFSPEAMSFFNPLIIGI